MTRVAWTIILSVEKLCRQPAVFFEWRCFDGAAFTCSLQHSSCSFQFRNLRKTNGITTQQHKPGPTVRMRSFPNYMGRCKIVFFQHGIVVSNVLLGWHDSQTPDGKWWFWGGLIVGGLIPIKGWSISPSVRHQWDIYIFWGQDLQIRITIPLAEILAPTEMYKKDVNNGINYQPELVGHQQ